MVVLVDRGPDHCCYCAGYRIGVWVNAHEQELGFLDHSWGCLDGRQNVAWMVGEHTWWFARFRV